ncbi:uncharacterized protein LOC114929741, partial [Nylanderia fulva]|uniref:uncharacterized protein LOC114929741 n=1 Tax=Nylanderia fulva TaxID=613905 RepID=UPI0010FB009C
RSDIGNNTEAIVEDIINVENEPSTSSLSTQETEDIEELLIEEVSRREILYNYNIPITQRNRLAISEQWQQVSIMLNGRLSAKEAQKKWKILRDTFCRKIAEDKQPSGAAGSKKKKWKHFDRMLFLKDTLITKQTHNSFRYERTKYSNSANCRCYIYNCNSYATVNIATISDPRRSRWIIFDTWESVKATNRRAKKDFNFRNIAIYV